MVLYMDQQKKTLKTKKKLFRSNLNISKEP